MEQAAVSTVGANGLPMDVVGQISLSVCICGTVVKQTFLVVEELTVEALLGTEFFDKHKAVLDFVHHRLTLGHQPTSISAVDKLPQAPLQVLTVAIGSDVEIPGRSVVTASGRLEGACLALSGLVEPHWHTGTPKHFLFARSVSTVREGCVELQVTNSIAPCQSSCFMVQRLASSHHSNRCKSWIRCRSKPNMPLHSNLTLTCLHLPCQHPRRRSCWPSCTISAMSLLRRGNHGEGQQWLNITSKRFDLQFDNDHVDCQHPSRGR